MSMQKGDFIEIEFTGRIKNGGIFDSNIKEDLEKANLKVDAKPFIFCLGKEMFLKGIDDFLAGKEIGKYEIELTPEKAFGNRNPKLVQIISIKIFREHKVPPVPGELFRFDNSVGKILSVSGGRVVVDFNNPLAGKILVYKIKIIREVKDINEKVKALNEFLFKKDFKFELEDKKIIIHVEKPMAKFVEIFKEKFKDVLGLEMEVKEEDTGKQ